METEKVIDAYTRLQGRSRHLRAMYDPHQRYSGYVTIPAEKLDKELESEVERNEFIKAAIDALKTARE